MCINDKKIMNAIQYSESMLENATMGNWNKVINMEVKRGELLEQLFSGDLKNNVVADMDTKIQKIIAINQQLETISLHARDNTRNELSSLSKGRQAVNVYAQNSA